MDAALRVQSPTIQHEYRSDLVQKIGREARLASMLDKMNRFRGVHVLYVSDCCPVKRTRSEHSVVLSKNLSSCLCMVSPFARCPLSVRNLACRWRYNASRFVVVDLQVNSASRCTEVGCGAEPSATRYHRLMKSRSGLGSNSLEYGVRIFMMLRTYF